MVAAEKVQDPRLKTEKQRRRAIAVRDRAQMKMAAKDFIYFLDFVYILEPPQPLVGITGGKTKFEKWPHIVRLAHDLVSHRLIQRLKARQDGLSWGVSSFYVWLLRFYDGSIMLELSRGQAESQVLLGKAKFIYKNLPESWQLPIDANSGSEFSLKGMDSRIYALPSTEDAGRGINATSIFFDEASFHQFLDASYLALKPTIDAGGQIIMGSTVNKKVSRSLFNNLYHGSPENGWVKEFWGWQVRPGRDREWYERVKKEAAALPDAIELGVDLYMEQEYPSSEQEALKPANALAAFDLENLERMKADYLQPIERIGHINIYQKFQWRKAYAAGTDASGGVGKDFAGTAVIDKDTGYMVACIFGQGIAPDELAVASLELMEMYRNPRWAIERNGEHGGVVFNIVTKARYPNHYKRQLSSGKRVKGWETGKTSRSQLWFDLIDATDAGGLTIPNPVVLAQFETVIRHPDNDYRPEAMIGEHDDGPMMLGLALQAATQATRRTAPEADAPKNTRMSRKLRLAGHRTSWHRGF